jgi:hypothetical protein
MIQFKRGKALTWHAQKTPLADGQPGYDKDRHKLKIGNGKDLWDDLPDASGLRLDDIISSEEEAKIKTRAKAALNPIASLLAKSFNLEDRTIFTYGTALPDDDTVGQIYLQQFEGAIERDYIIDFGRNINYFYRKWNSGFMECWGKGEIPDKIEDLFTSTIYKQKSSEYFEIRGYWN